MPGTITCRCQKCIAAAEARTGPSISNEWPLPPLKHTDEAGDHHASASSAKGAVVCSMHVLRSSLEAKEVRLCLNGPCHRSLGALELDSWDPFNLSICQAPVKLSGSDMVPKSAG